MGIQQHTRTFVRIIKNTVENIGGDMTHQEMLDELKDSKVLSGTKEGRAFFIDFDTRFYLGFIFGAFITLLVYPLFFMWAIG